MCMCKTHVVFQSFKGMSCLSGDNKDQAISPFHDIPLFADDEVSDMTIEKFFFFLILIIGQLNLDCYNIVRH